ncbi:MAG TPA: hypothetical protein VM778_08460 [Gemmatimonadota bacterium]|nr:hypothetical protein [Gemmatimonadota bacterium]
MSSRSSLIPFHRVLISAGILFCGGFAVYTGVIASREDGGAGMYLLTAVFAVFALVLGYYLWHLKRFVGYRDD